MAKGKIESVKERLQGLIDLSNEVTEGEHTDLTSAVTDLAEKAKKGGSASFADNEAGGMTYTVKAGEVTGEGDETLKANKFVLNGEAKIDLTNDTVLEEDVRKGKTFHKADGSQGVGTGGGAELNIAYGDTAPEDTSKLWVKTEEAPAVEVHDMNACRILSVALPEKMYEIKYAVYGKKLFIFGYNQSATKSIYCYDAEDESKGFELLTYTMPLYFRYSSFATVGDYIYLIGGESSQYSSNTTTSYQIYKLHLPTMEWTLLNKTLDTAVKDAKSVVVGSKIYLIGSLSYSQSIYCFNTETEDFTLLTAKTTAKLREPGCALVGTDIYIFGGHTSNTATTTYANCLDTTSDTITSLTNVPGKRGGMGCAAVGDKIYLLGGKDNAGYYYDTVYSYNVSSKKYLQETYNLTEGKFNMATLSDGANIYLLGGYCKKANYNYGTTDIEEVAVVQPLDKDVLWIRTASGSPYFQLLKERPLQITPSVYGVYKGNAEGKAELVEAALYKNGAWTNV